MYWEQNGFEQHSVAAITVTAYKNEAPVNVTENIFHLQRHEPSESPQQHSFQYQRLTRSHKFRIKSRDILIVPAEYILLQRSYIVQIRPLRYVTQ